MPSPVRSATAAVCGGLPTTGNLARRLKGSPRMPVPRPTATLVGLAVDSATSSGAALFTKAMGGVTPPRSTAAIARTDGTVSGAPKPPVPSP